MVSVAPVRPSPESVETSNWWILFWARSSCLVPAAVRGVPPAAGVNAGRRPPAGLGVDPGEDGATLGSRKRGARSRRLFRWVLGGGVAALVGDRGEHAQRRVAPVVVVVLDPAGDRGAGVGFGGESLPCGAARPPGWSARPRSRRCLAPPPAGPSTGGCPPGRRPPAPVRRCPRCLGQCAGCPRRSRPARRAPPPP